MFGSAFFLTRVAVQEVPPVMVVAGRIVIGALLLLIIAYAQGEKLSSLRPYWPILIILALTGNCIPFFVITWGQQYVDSGLAGILMAMMPLTTVVLAHFFVRGEQMTKNKTIGFLLGFMGVVILMRPELFLKNDLDWIHITAMLLILSGAVSYAANSVIAHSLPKISLSLISAGVLLAASFMIIPISILQEFTWVNTVSVSAVWAVIMLGIFPSGLATIIYFRVIRHAGPAFLSQINYLIPVWAVFLGVIFGGEMMAINSVIALILILAGIAIAQKNRTVTAESIYHE